VLTPGAAVTCNDCAVALWPLPTDRELEAAGQAVLFAA
jgi:hypothetical protein